LCGAKPRAPAAVNVNGSTRKNARNPNSGRTQTLQSSKARAFAGQGAARALLSGPASNIMGSLCPAAIQRGVFLGGNLIFGFIYVDFY